jgi:type IV pilus assembly protein PilB
MRKMLHILSQIPLLNNDKIEQQIYEYQSINKICTFYAIQHVISKHYNLNITHQIIEKAAKIYGLATLDLSKEKINQDVFTIIDKKIIEENLILPITIKNNKLLLAITNPENLDIVDNLKFTISLDIQPILISLQDFSYFKNRLENSNKNNDSLLANYNQSRETITICNEILQNAVNKKASDIHLEPTLEGNLKIKYRINGELLNMQQIPNKFKDSIIARIKLLSNLDIAEKRLPQDGKLKIRLNSANKELTYFRVSTISCITGEKIVLRLVLNKDNFEIDSIGLSHQQLNILIQHLNKMHGIILVTGPTGCGKSMTLYSCLKYLNNKKHNILTIEDPVEITIDGINQVAVNDKIGVTFSSILKNFLRQDPDVIMIGEIRDYSSAEIAISAAQTGHLILSTLHTNDTYSAITRLLNLGIANYNLVDSLSLVIAQRLVKTLCPNCKLKTQLSAEDLKKIKDMAPISVQKNTNIKFYFLAQGCQYCHETGYSGRTAIFDFLTINNTISHLIMSPNFSTILLKENCTQKHLNLSEKAADLLFAGIIDLHSCLYC